MIILKGISAISAIDTLTNQSTIAVAIHRVCSNPKGPITVSLKKSILWSLPSKLVIIKEKEIKKNKIVSKVDPINVETNGALHQVPCLSRSKIATSNN